MARPGSSPAETRLERAQQLRFAGERRPFISALL